MSSYSCVIPIDWQALWCHVVPAWISVLAGDMSPGMFAKNYASKGASFGDGELIGPYDRFHAPSDYLSLFSEGALRPPFSRRRIAGSGLCAEFLRRTDSYALPLIEAAIKQSTAVDLPGPDSFHGNYFGRTTDASGTWQVVGTRNDYEFLERWFDVAWQREDSLYTYARRAGHASARLHELLEALFLYERAIPGLWFPAESPSWPAHDDHSFAGYLSPDEVKELAAELSRSDVISLQEDDSELFLLFVDRVARSSAHDHGLLTIHGGF